MLCFYPSKWFLSIFTLQESWEEKLRWVNSKQLSRREQVRSESFSFNKFHHQTVSTFTLDTFSSSSSPCWRLKLSFTLLSSFPSQHSTHNNWTFNASSVKWETFILILLHFHSSFLPHTKLVELNQLQIMKNVFIFVFLVFFFSSSKTSTTTWFVLRPFMKFE